ncbi:neurofilament heavy polypeptide-like [Engraulis encrasicolus]|uniref:neurofilament heavy polypeptide-like n=1 Tax=Engraulis encrasicolus TaxID=184585 RepID=UPI002FD0924F
MGLRSKSKWRHSAARNTTTFLRLKLKRLPEEEQITAHDGGELVDYEGGMMMMFDGLDDKRATEAPLSMDVKGGEEEEEEEVLLWEVTEDKMRWLLEKREKDGGMRKEEEEEEEWREERVLLPPSQNVSYQVVFEGLGWVALDDIKIVDGISPEDCQASTLLPHLGSTPTSPSSHPGASQGPSDPVSASEPPPERARPDWTATSSSSETSRTPNSTDSSPGNGGAGDASPTGASSGPEHPTDGGTSEESRTPGVEDRGSVDPAPSPDSSNLDNAPSPDDSENSDDSDSVVRFPDTSSPDSSSPLMPIDKDDIDSISNTDGDESKTPFADNNDNVSDKNFEGGVSFDNSNDDGDYEDDDDDDDSDSDNISGRSSTTPVLRTLDPILITIIAMSALGVLLGSVCGVLLYCACGTEEDGEDGTEEQPSEAQKRVLQNYNFELVKKKNKKNAANTQQLQEKDTMKEFTEV